MINQTIRKEGVIFKIYREKPIELSLLPRLIARLGDSKEKEELMSRLRRRSAGYHGEKRVDYFLEKAHFNIPIKILADIALEITPRNFIQIDTLILTRSFIFILEIKNITGELRFIQNPPCLHRTSKNGEVDIMDCPVYQLEKNIEDFNYWLEMSGFPLKSSGALVLAYTTSQVVIPPATMPIFYAKQLPQFLRKKESESPIMSREQLDNLATKLLKENHPYIPIPLCTHFRIDPSIVKTGILCSECHEKLIRNTRRIWSCPSCGELIKKPYADNLKDWFAFVRNSITTEECRKFLDLKNSDAAKYALKSLPLKKDGKSIATKYYFPTLNKTLRK